MSKFIKLENLTRFWTNVKSYIDNGLAGKAAIEHTHAYAAISHTHEQSEINGLTEALAGKAASDHTHTEYASASHTHSDYALKSDITSVYRYKGSVTAYSELPTDADVGDVYNVEGDNGQNYAWTGSAWDSLGGSIQIEVATDEDIDALFA